MPSIAKSIISKFLRGIKWNERKTQRKCLCLSGAENKGRLKATLALSVLHILREAIFQDC